MRKVVHWARCIGLLVPVLLLVFAATPRLQSGLAVDAAYPVPILMVADLSVPQSSYLDTAVILAAAHRDDGESKLQYAEALSLAQPGDEMVLELLRDGLAISPASVRGWALLAEELGAVEPQRAAQALGLSLLLGPYEYFVALKRARQAAMLWDGLSTDARAAALEQTRLLWSEESLNDELLRLLDTQGGSELLARAFINDPEELRAINRWVTTERRNASR